MRKRWALGGFVLAAFAAGFMGSCFMPGDWYAALVKPSFIAPDSVFAPVWRVLYLLMAIIAWRAWRKAGLDLASGLWLAKLGLTATWSWLFFGRRLLAGALMEIVVLLALIVATTAVLFRRDRTAGWLMVPHIAWVGFATLLNASLWQRNPSA